MVLSNQKHYGSIRGKLHKFRNSTYYIEKRGLTAARLIDCKKQKVGQFTALPQ